jgi:hypothetical protein
VELVPFRPQWAGSETKLDLKAWYRRPSSHGGFSIVGPFPLRRHLDWTRKGFEFVTLGSGEDFTLVAASLRGEGLNTDLMMKAYDHRGVFKMAEYLNEAKASDAAYIADLQAKVDKFGPETVTEMMRVSTPDFVLPEAIVINPPDAVTKSVEKRVVVQKGDPK